MISGCSSHKAEGVARGCDGHSKAFVSFLTIFFKMLCNCLACFVFQVLSVLVTCVISIYWDICSHGNASWHWEARSHTGGHCPDEEEEEGKGVVERGLCPPIATPLQRFALCHSTWSATRFLARASLTQQGPNHQRQHFSSLTVFHTPDEGTVNLRESPAL